MTATTDVANRIVDVAFHMSIVVLTARLADVIVVVAVVVIVVGGDGGIAVAVVWVANDTINRVIVTRRWR